MKRTPGPVLPRVAGPRQASNGKSYPAVKVVVPAASCQAAGSLKGAVTLAVDAPRLPLMDCSMPDRCRCRFEKYADRRNGDEDRRLTYDSVRANWYADAERRRLDGRRDDD